MTMPEEITISHEDLGARRGVLIIICEISRDKIKALGRSATLDEIAAVSSFRVVRQWNRGKSKEVMIRCDSISQAEGYVCGVRDGIKLANA